MPTVIDELGQLCASLPGARIQMQAADMLVELPTSGGRRQTVKVSTTILAGGGLPVVRLQSRAALVHNYKLVFDSLRHNNGIAHGLRA